MHPPCPQKICDTVRHIKIACVKSFWRNSNYHLKWVSDFNGPSLSQGRSHTDSLPLPVHSTYIQAFPRGPSSASFYTSPLPPTPHNWHLSQPCSVKLSDDTIILVYFHPTKLPCLKPYPVGLNCNYLQCTETISGESNLILYNSVSLDQVLLQENTSFNSFRQYPTALTPTTTCKCL